MKKCVVGNIYKTNNCGDVELLEIIDGNYVNIRFLNTGYERRVHKSHLISGELKDISLTIEGSVGQKFETYSSGMIKILEYTNSNRILVEFENTGSQRWCSLTHILGKKLYDYYAPVVYGVGFTGQGDFSATKDNRAYRQWHDMMRRCYSDEVEKFPTYVGVTVCEEWYCFQNFAAWATKQDAFYYKKPVWQLDKDLLMPGCKIYSPDTCCYLPNKINSFMIKTNVNGSYNPKAKSWTFFGKNTEGKKISRTFKDKEEGLTWYKNTKQATMRRLAEEHKHLVPENVYLAMLNWEL